jgi:hypothetical protein
MNIMDFTVEETNLIAIYEAETKAATLKRIADALPHMVGDMREIAESASHKLAVLTENELAETPFIPTDNFDG